MSDHAELMTLWICQGLPFHAVCGNRSSDSACPQRLEVADVAGWIIGMDVKVHPVLARLRLRDRLQDQHRARRLIGKRRKDSVAIGAIHQLVAEGHFPERQESIGIEAVEDNRNAHGVTL
jgi:hypothetical protein